MSHSDCPVYWQANQALNSTRRVAGMLRKLRRALRACRRCPAAQDCPVVQNFNLQLEDALAEIAEAWGLGETI